jgi:hypothetical protein
MKFPSNKKYNTLNKGYGNNKIKVVTTIFFGLQTEDKLEKKHSGISLTKR